MARFRAKLSPSSGAAISHEASAICCSKAIPARLLHRHSVVPECGGREELVRFTGKPGCRKDSPQRRNFSRHFGGRTVLIRAEQGPAISSNTLENNDGRRARQRLPRNRQRPLVPHVAF